MGEVVIYYIVHASDDLSLYDLQEFISNHTKYYYDRFHGYWLGLDKTNNKDWVWIDGRNDTLG